jgi:hypothetical protein
LSWKIFLPGRIVFLIFFPINKGWGEGNVLRACKEDVGAHVLGIWSAVFAVCWEARMKSFVVFARGGVICDGAGHAAHGFDIIARHIQEEAMPRFVDDVWFEEPTL